MTRTAKRWISIEELDDLKGDLALLVSKEKQRAGVRHLDLRVALDEGFNIATEEVTLKSYQKDFSLNYGIRAIAGPKDASANGFIGGSIGASDFKNATKILRNAITIAYDRAGATARRKLVTKSRLVHLTKSILPEVTLARIPVIRDTLKAEYETDPRTVDKREAEEYLLDVAGDIKKRFREIKSSAIRAFSFLERQLFSRLKGASSIRHQLSPGRPSTTPPNPARRSQRICTTTPATSSVGRC